MRQHNAPGRDPLMPLTLAWASLLFICLVALWSFSNLGDLRFEGDMRIMRLEAPPEDSSLKRAYREEVVGRAPSPAVLITGGGEETERVTRHLEALRPKLGSHRSRQSIASSRATKTRSLP